MEPIIHLDLMEMQPHFAMTYLASFPSMIKCPLYKNSLTEIEYKYVKKEVFVKVINEIKEHFGLIVPLKKANT